MTQPDATAITITGDHRTIAVATLHSIANSMANGLDAPMPEHVTFYRHDVAPGDFLDLARHYETLIHFGDKHRWIEIPLATTELHSIDAIYLIFVNPEYDRVADPDYLAHNAAVNSMVAL